MFDPFLFTTFLFAPMIMARTAFLDVGGFSVEYSSGDKIETQLRICNRFGEGRVAYWPEVIYRYRKHSASAVHDPRLYAELINNIEAILTDHASRRWGREYLQSDLGDPDQPARRTTV